MTVEKRLDPVERNRGQCNYRALRIANYGDMSGIDEWQIRQIEQTAICIHDPLSGNSFTLRLDAAGAETIDE